MLIVNNYNPVISINEPLVPVTLQTFLYMNHVEHNLTLPFFPCIDMQHLEQEKHELRRRLESREGEWEGRVAELETDVQQLQEELERHQVQLREADRDKTKAISELSEQNHRLLEQLSRVSKELLVCVSECVFAK